MAMEQEEEVVGAATPDHVLTARGAPDPRFPSATTFRSPYDSSGHGPRTAATPLVILCILLPLLLLSGNASGQQEPQQQRKHATPQKKPAERGRTKTIGDLFNTTSCANPPYRCPYPRIEFYLYTRATQEEPEKLDLLQDAGPSLMETHFDASFPTKVVIHGFGGGRKLSPSPDMRKAYFTRGEYNVIIVDYSSLVVEPCLGQVEWAPRFCALCIAQVIGWLDDAWRWSIGNAVSAVSANRVTRSAAANRGRGDFDGRRAITPQDFDPSAPEEYGVFGEKIVPSRQRIVPSVQRIVPSRQRIVPSRQRTVPSRQRTVPSRQRTVPSRQRVVPSEQRVVPSEQRVVPSEQRIVPSEQRVVPSEQRVVASTEKISRETVEATVATPRRLRIVGSPPEGVHVIGYSVGAHIAGLVANYVGERRIGRITGLDPTIIFYMGSNRSRDLDPTDALFVDVIHTGAGVLGQWGPNGHVDFYVNGGTSQPGCTGGIYETLACDHQKVTPYFIESITSKTGFWATPCSNLLLYLVGWCTTTDKSKLIKMGEDVSLSARGIYYLETNARRPYAKGLPTDNSRRKR